MRKVMVIVVLVLAGLLGAAVPVVLAAPVVQETTIPLIVEGLAFVAKGLATGAVISFLFENFDWFKRLAPKSKRWVVFGVSLALPVLAQALLDFVPVDVWAVLEPYWQALASGFLAWAGGQATYTGLIEPRRREEEAYRLLRERHTG